MFFSLRCYTATVLIRYISGMLHGYCTDRILGTNWAINSHSRYTIWYRRKGVKIVHWRMLSCNKRLRKELKNYENQTDEQVELFVRDEVVLLKI